MNFVPVLFKSCFNSKAGENRRDNRIERMEGKVSAWTYPAKPSVYRLWWQLLIRDKPASKTKRIREGISHVRIKFAVLEEAFRYKLLGFRVGLGIMRHGPG